MNKKRLIILFTAAIAAIAAVMMVTRNKNVSEEDNWRAEVKADSIMVRVLVMTEDLFLGQKLNSHQMAWKDWPEQALNDGYILENNEPNAIEELSGKIVKYAMLAKEPVRRQKLVAEGGGLAALLPTGKRALSLSIPLVNQAGGFVGPNDKVDLMISEARNGSRSLARVLLPNVRVIAVGRRIGAPGNNQGESEGQQNLFQSAGGNEGENEGSELLTFEVSPEESEIILNAKTSGSISLVLRSAEDFDEAVDGQKNKRAKFVKIITGGQIKEVSAVSN